MYGSKNDITWTRVTTEKALLISENSNIRPKTQELLRTQTRVTTDGGACFGAHSDICSFSCFLSMAILCLCKSLVTLPPHYYSISFQMSEDYLCTEISALPSFTARVPNQLLSSNWHRNVQKNYFSNGCLEDLYP